MGTPVPNPKASGHSGYHEFENEGLTYGHFEVYWHPRSPDQGWYWHPCFPGCLPDAEPRGPFLSSRDAYKDARGE